MSSETMKVEDDMIVFMIEDEEHFESGDLNIQVPFPITVKVEPLDDSGHQSGSEVFPTAHTEENEDEDDDNEEEKFDGDDDQVREEIKTIEQNERDGSQNVDKLSSQDVQNENTEENEVVQDNEHREEENEEYEAEYLDENAIKQELLDLSDDYEIEFLEEDVLFEDNLSDEDYVDSENKHWRKKNRGNFVSVADQLRKEHPELKMDTDKLVERLAEIMRETKPPPPPANHCKVVIGDNKTVQYKCSFCGKKRPTLPLAARHYQFSHGECYLTCLACGVRYRNTTNLYKHEKRCSAPDGRLVLRARGHYLGRKGRGRPYTTENPFVTCNTRLRALSKQKGTRLFCSKCPASFAHRENLEAHELSHEGLRPYHCGHCPAKYTSVPALRRHFRAVHGNDQFICDHCGAVFKLKPLLVSHMDSHRVIRKHPCSYCERRFAQKTALRHHINKVHLNLPAAHGCPLCTKRYPRMTQVKDHMAVVHGLTMITRRMYYQSLPNLPQEALQVTLQPSLVNHTISAKNYKIEPRIKRKPQSIVEYKMKHQNKHKKENKVIHIDDIEEILPDWPLQEYVELDLRDKKTDDSFISYVVVKDGVPTKINTGIKEDDVLEKLLKSETVQGNETAEILTKYEIDDNEQESHIDENVSEIGTDKTVLENETDKTVPENETDETVPENETDETVPDIETDETVPEIETDKTVPEIETDKTVPEIETDETVPEIETDKTVPENETDKKFPENETVDNSPEYIIEKKKPKRSHKKKIVDTPKPEIDEKDEDFDKTVELKSKREKKEKKPDYIVPDTEPVDESAQKVVRDIKSTLRKRKITENPDQKTKTKPSVPTELQPYMKATPEDVKDWEDYKRLSKKGVVVAEFLEYMSSKKVPSHTTPKSVPILRKKFVEPEPSSVKPSPWLAKTRGEILSKPDPEDKVAPSVVISEVVTEEQ